ncbi:unnamed protein product [Echinostoma caproni]|uniref:Uncharacterized protein n=1 Tax=Echinostoma caproni TaxID=27848 RepID=A0A183AF29_9TREM|nr:unnamed protein product [Echinostoma caproni]
MLSELSMCAGAQSQRLEAMEQSSVLVVGLSGAYHLSPGCRMDSEYFMSTATDANAKPTVPIVLQPKLKPTEERDAIHGMQATKDGLQVFLKRNRDGDEEVSAVK